MGRIKTKMVKRFTHKLMELHSDEITNDFEKNKKIINELVYTPSKKLRNIIAGYSVRYLNKKNGYIPSQPNLL